MIEFQGYSNHHCGEKVYEGFEKIQYIVYWHKYLCSNDEGMSKQIYIGESKE